MNFSPESISYFSVWVVNIIYFVGLFPQIWLNYQLKTVKGLSNLMLLGLITGYVTFWYHIYFKNFPMSYQVMVPIGLLTSLAIVFQSFYYHGYKRRMVFLASYIALFAFSILLFPVALKYPVEIAKICGWIYFSIWLVYMLPQVFKIYMEKSVRGFSFGFVSLMAFGVLVEFIAAFFIKLSLQIVLNCLRGLIGYIIFCVFFYMYRNNN